MRTQVLRTKSTGTSSWHSDAAQLAAAVATTVGWAFDLVPTAALVAIVALLAVNLVAVRLTPKPPAVIGTQQMIFGMAVILTTALALS